jgi:hypothetical protein
MDATPMSKQAESRLLNAVKEAVAWVEDGTHPNDAIVKVASELQLGRPMTQLLVQAYNTGRSTYQREKAAGDVLGLVEEFPLADFGQVSETLWPADAESFKSAAVVREAADASCYDRPPRWESQQAFTFREKVAHQQIPGVPKDDSREKFVEKKSQMAAAYNDAAWADRQLEDARHNAAVAKEEFVASLGKLANYFKQPELFRLSFAEVARTAEEVHGNVAKSAMDFVYQRNQMKEARELPVGQNVLVKKAALQQEPFTLLADALERGRKATKLAHEYEQKREQTYKQIKEALAPFSPLLGHDSNQNVSPLLRSDSNSSREPLPSFSKESGLLGGMLAGSVGAGVTKAMTPKPSEELVAADKANLADPEHQNELRKIEAQTVLSDLMQNDEVLSSYSPEEVLHAYNEVSAMSPRLATQSAALRPLLRKRMTQGGYEPFEAQQLADIEKTISQTDNTNFSKTSGVIHGSRILQ